MRSTMSGSRNALATAACKRCDEIARPAGRHLQTHHGGVVEPLDAELDGGRHVGDRFRALLRADAENAKLAVLDQRQHVGHAGPSRLHLALDEPADQGGAAAIGHVQEIDAGLRGEDRHREVMDRAGSGRAVCQLAGFRPGEGDELLQRARRHRRVHDQHGRDRHQRRDRGEIPQAGRNRDLD